MVLDKKQQKEGEKCLEQFHTSVAQFRLCPFALLTCIKESIHNINMPLRCLHKSCRSIIFLNIHLRTFDCKQDSKIIKHCLSVDFSRVKNKSEWEKVWTSTNSLILCPVALLTCFQQSIHNINMPLLRCRHKSCRSLIVFNIYLSSMQYSNTSRWPLHSPLMG